MEINKSKKVLTQKENKILEFLSNQDFFYNFYLAGGTALALQIHHRKSVDLDFFTQSYFNHDNLSRQLKNLFKANYKILGKEKNTLHSLINNTRTSFIRYNYPLLEKKQKKYLDIKLAGIKDIAAMKLSAIQGRGTKRDFIDLYFICKYYYSFSNIISFHKRKFTSEFTNPLIIYKSLNFFKDADKEPTPKLLYFVTWNEIKVFLISESIKYFKKVL